MKVNFYLNGDFIFKKKMKCVPNVGEHIEYARHWMVVTERLFHVDKRICEVDVYLKNAVS